MFTVLAVNKSDPKRQTPHGVPYVWNPDKEELIVMERRRLFPEVGEVGRQGDGKILLRRSFIRISPGDAHHNVLQRWCALVPAEGRVKVAAPHPLD